VNTTDINLAEGPWPDRVSERLLALGIPRWQMLQRLYADRPNSLAGRVAGTTADDWKRWFALLPEPPLVKAEFRPLGLMPDVPNSPMNQGPEEAGEPAPPPRKPDGEDEGNDEPTSAHEKLD